jgi:hypothetical protein
MANRNNHLNPSQAYEPARCWVGDTHKIIYATEEEAELAAKVAAYDHHLDRPLKVYKCPYANHYHLASE